MCVYIHIYMYVILSDIVYSVKIFLQITRLYSHSIPTSIGCQNLATWPSFRARPGQWLATWWFFVYSEFQDPHKELDVWFEDLKLNFHVSDWFSISGLDSSKSMEYSEMECSILICSDQHWTIHFVAALVLICCATPRAMPFLPEMTYWCVSRREWMGIGLAGMIMIYHPYVSIVDHSLIPYV